MGKREIEYCPDVQIVPVPEEKWEISKRKEIGRTPVCILPVIDIQKILEDPNEEEEEMWN